MKKIIVMLAISSISIGLHAQANTTPEKKTKTGMTETTYRETPVQNDKTTLVVPEKVKAAFNSGYYTKDINPTWKREGANYKVDFTNGGIESIAVYDKNGKVLRTERQLGKTDYPAEITGYLSKNHMNADDIVWEQNIGDGKTIKYFVKENGRVTWFDKNGNRITGNEHMAHHTTGKTHHTSGKK